MAKMMWTNTNDALQSVRGVVVRSLRDELKLQKHIATGRLSRGIKGGKIFNIRGGKALNIISSVDYWRAVNNPKFAKKPNIETVKKWAKAKGLPASSFGAIYNKLINKHYGKPYTVWTEGNSLRRTNFAGYAANKVKGKVREGVQEGVVKDVIKMIRTSFKEELGTKNVRFIK